jgi:hypothetical protein
VETAIHNFRVRKSIKRLDKAFARAIKLSDNPDGDKSSCYLDAFGSYYIRTQQQEVAKAFRKIMAAAVIEVEKNENENTNT